MNNWSLNPQLEHHLFQKAFPGDFPGDPAVGTLPSNAEGVGLIPGQRAKMPLSQKTKTYNRSNVVTNWIKTLKMVHTKKILKKKKKGPFLPATHPPLPHQPQWAGPHSILPELPLLQHFPHHEEMVSECVRCSQWIVSSSRAGIGWLSAVPQSPEPRQVDNKPSGGKMFSWSELNWHLSCITRVSRLWISKGDEVYLVYE